MTSEVLGKSAPRIGSNDKAAPGRPAGHKVGAAPVRSVAARSRTGPPLKNPPNVDAALAWVRGFDAARRYVNWLYPKRGRMLEVGSGYGFLMAAFKADGWRVHGIDTDEASCRYARECNGVTTHAVPLRDAGIPNEAFDFVIFGRLLAPQTDLREVLAEVGRILRPGGHCLIDLPVGGRATPGDGWGQAIGAGFRVVPFHRPDLRIDMLVRTISLGWSRLRRAPIAESQPPDGWKRVWLQRVAVVAADGVARNVTVDAHGRSALPAWLSDEVAGVVTIAARQDAPERDIRRGYPWRVPDRLFARSAVATISH